MRTTLALAAVAAACVLPACGASDGGQPTSRETTANKPTAQPDPAPAEIRGSRAQLGRCVDRWNAAASAANEDRAQGSIAAQAASNPDSLSATVTLYDGEPIADRRDRCVVFVAEGSTAFSPFSPVKGSGVWGSACRLVGAKPDEADPRKCSSYTAPLAAAANAEFAPDGQLRLEGS